MTAFLCELDPSTSLAEAEISPGYTVASGFLSWLALLCYFLRYGSSGWLSWTLSPAVVFLFVLWKHVPRFQMGSTIRRKQDKDNATPFLEWVVCWEMGTAVSKLTNNCVGQVDGQGISRCPRMPWEMMHGSEEPHCSNKYHQFMESSQEKGLRVVPITTQVHYWDVRWVMGSSLLPCNGAVHLGLDIFLWMLFSLQLQNKKGHGKLQPNFREQAENWLLASYISPWTCLRRKLEWSLVGSPECLVDISRPFATRNSLPTWDGQGRHKANSSAEDWTELAWGRSRVLCAWWSISHAKEAGRVWLWLHIELCSGPQSLMAWPCPAP